MKHVVIALVIILSASLLLNLTFIKNFNNEKEDYSVENAISIMVYDDSLSDYVQRSTIPIGSYRLNEDKTSCTAGGKVSNYNNQTGKINYSLGTADECYVYFDEYYGAIKTIMNLYKEQGTEVGNGKLYFHDNTLNDGAEDNSYRFAGTDPNNYLCFEGDTCDDTHKYRVIGIVGDNVKVIKMTSVGNKQWNSSNVNTWVGSTMDTYLNGQWLTSFGHADLIEDYDWHVGGHNAYVTSKVMHGVEMTSTPVVNRKVGLMYVSDYGFAAENTYWTKSINNYGSTDWLKLGATEWTISRFSGNSGVAFGISSSGSVYRSDSGNTNCSFATRPVFYLKPSVEIKSGSGSKTDPWIMG